jgi:hypothetical protein
VRFAGYDFTLCDPVSPAYPERSRRVVEDFEYSKEQLA